MIRPHTEGMHPLWTSCRRFYSVLMSSYICGTWYHRLSRIWLYKKHLIVFHLTYPKQSFTGITETTDDWRCHVQTQKNTLI